ncbi:MAG: hypothetical protein LBQ86_02745 [Holophagales bacterium]|nr:hypothetical protein [Holophagales bacterium]
MKFRIEPTKAENVKIANFEDACGNLIQLMTLRFQLERGRGASARSRSDAPRRIDSGTGV